VHAHTTLEVIFYNEMRYINLRFTLLYFSFTLLCTRTGEPEVPKMLKMTSPKI